MQAAKAFSLVGLLLTACQKATPDFSFTMPSPDGRHIANVFGFQPRGTIEGQLVLTFGKDAQGTTALFRQVTNAKIGWTSPAELAVIADEIAYRGISSDYYPDGTVRSRIHLVTCIRSAMNCSSLEDRMVKGDATKFIRQFPE